MPERETQCRFWGWWGERGLKVAVNSDRVLTEIDLESRLGFAHPVLDAHA